MLIGTQDGSNLFETGEVLGRKCSTKVFPVPFWTLAQIPGTAYDPLSTTRSMPQASLNVAQKHTKKKLK